MTEKIKIQFPVTMTSVSVAEDVLAAVTANAVSDKNIAYKIRTALSEAFSNAFLYCEKNFSDAAIELEFCFNKDRFVASVINQGSGIADKAIKWNDFPSAMAESGRGLKIIKKLSDKLEFIHHDDNRFEVRMEFSLQVGQKIN